MRRRRSFRIPRDGWGFPQDCSPTCEGLLTYASHVGSYSEEISLTGEQIGNFPQAFTQLALIAAAVTLDTALDATPR